MPADPLTGAASVRKPNEQGHAQQLVVDRVAVSEGAVLQKLFAVIGGHDDERVLEAAARAPLRQETGDRTVDSPRFTEIESADPVAVLARPATERGEPRRIPGSDDAELPWRLSGVRREETSVLGRGTVLRMRIEVVDPEEERSRRYRP